ncbi:MAG: hypothetical protein IT426_20900 [Pirellulales bacterium]|nr:hypothetical protein [Pirellulales bacterium]
MRNNFFGGTLAVLIFSSLARADEATARVNLDNLAPSTNAMAGWSDRHSNLVLSWPQEKESGLQQLVSLVGWGGTPITTKLLGWNLTAEGKPLKMHWESRTFRPDKVVEVDAAEGIELTATTSWPGRNTLAVEFLLVNRTEKPRDMTLSFSFPGKGQPPDWKGPFPAGKFVSLENETEGSWTTLYVHNEHGRNVLWVRDYVAGMTDGTTLELTCLADLSPRKLHFEPQDRIGLVIPLGFGRNRGEARDALDAAAAKIAKGWSSAEETDRLRELLRKAPPLPAKYRGQEKYERLYAHAITTLGSLCIRGEGGYTGAKRIPYTTKFALACAFFWDTSFSCTGLREFDPAAAQEAISCFTENAGPRGSLPGTLCDSHRAGEGQAPIMSWAAWLTYQRSRDKTWLRRVYPALAGNNRFWFKHHASPRGLCQFFNAGQIADDDARFDPIQGDKRNWTLTGFESPDLNAFLVMDCRCLAAMADELEKRDDAQAWREQADRLAEKIVETMYFPDDALFYDVKTGTREILSGVKTPNMFLPLWAGTPLNKAQIGAVVERHILNPREFYRDLPFPSLSYDNPKYDPQGYWRGRIWPHVVYWMIQTLWRQGYEKEAERTADRLLALLMRTPWLHENYESGQGGGIGCPDYNWTCATAIELLLERYKDPPP